MFTNKIVKDRFGKILLLTGLLLVLCVGIFFRLSDLGERPVHFDEATGARIASSLRSDEGYRYDPYHFHGPILAYASHLVFALRGEYSWAEFSVESLRISVVMASIGSMLLLAVCGFLSSFSKWVTAALVASSPYLFYYDRMFVHEVWLVFGSVLLFTGIAALLRRQRKMNFLLIGVALICLLSTKGTALLYMVIWGMSWGVTLWVVPRLRAEMRSFVQRHWSALIWTTFFVICGLVLVYTTGFQHPVGIIDFVRSFFIYEVTPGHEKGVCYFLEMLFIPEKHGRYYWSEMGVLLLLLFTSIACLQKKIYCENGWRVFFLVSTLAMWVVYSLNSYKTPWLVLVPWIQTLILCGLTIDRKLLDFRSVGGWALVSFLLVVLGWQVFQTSLLVRYAERSNRHPYAYVPTMQQVEKLSGFVQELQMISESLGIDQRTVVSGGGHWPVPWYLRGNPNVVYGKATVVEGKASAILATVSEEEKWSVELANTHTAVPWGLRPDEPLYVFIKKEIWERYLITP